MTTVQRSIGRRAAVFASSVVLVLAGCAEFDDAFNGPSRETVSVPVMTSTNAPPPPPSLLGLAAPPRPRPRAPTRAAASSTPRATEEVGAHALAAAPPPTSAARLLGLTASSLETWLGQPQQRLDAAPARVWRYLEDECRIDAFLYLDLQTKEFHVLHYEVATNDSSDQPKDECIRQILIRNGGRVPGPGPGPVQAENRIN